MINLQQQMFKNKIVYILIIVFTLSIIVSLPFIHTDISIKSTGITRPVTERTEVKLIMTGIIESIFHKEGEKVESLLAKGLFQFP